MTSSQVNLNEITDPNQLKALAYDQIAAREQAERNLQAIQQRLADLEARQAHSQAKQQSEH